MKDAKDTTVRIDIETRDRLQELAEGRHLSVKDYLAALAREKENERRLDTATAVFRRVIAEPGLVEQFDAEFGGLPAADHDRQAA